MKKTFLNIIFIDISVADALLHLGGKESMSESVCLVKTNSEKQTCQEIQRTNSILTQTSPKVATSELKIMSFNCPATEYAQLQIPVSWMHCLLFTPSFLKNKSRGSEEKDQQYKQGWVNPCCVVSHDSLNLRIPVISVSYFLSFCSLEISYACLWKTLLREMLNTELQLEIYANQSENWKNRDYINFEKNYFYGRTHRASFIWGVSHVGFF